MSDEEVLTELIDRVELLARVNLGDGCGMDEAVSEVVNDGVR